MTAYSAYIERKSQDRTRSGFSPIWIPDFLYDFQRDLLEWSLVKGRSAIFADCGLGKTPIQLAWAENVVRQTNKPVLILAPLAVSAQTKREAEKFGIEAAISRDGKPKKNISIANYEMLNHFSPDKFGGVVCDESSILKNFNGKTKAAITEFLKKIPYRLLCTATAAPNDFHELGTSGEALGHLGYMDMLNRFFVNGHNNSANGRFHGAAIKWRIKGHAQVPFWRWVASWSRAIRRPSDIGYDDGDFVLPELEENTHLVPIDTPRDGEMFYLPARNLQEQREDRRNTINQRCQKVATLADRKRRQSLAWCNINAEGDLLAKMIPGATQVSGSDPPELKEEKLLAFANREIRVLVTKPKIGAWGLNFQNCNHVVFFPTYSYEQYYQGIRRCWRFPQEKKVVVDVVTTEGERGITEALRRKSKQADEMFDAMIEHVNDAMAVDSGYKPEQKEEVPAWL